MSDFCVSRPYFPSCERAARDAYICSALHGRTRLHSEPIASCSLALQSAHSGLKPFILYLLSVPTQTCPLWPRSQGLSGVATSLSSLGAWFPDLPR
eukprot:4960755-Amphidinium_carterae.1